MPHTILLVHRSVVLKTFLFFLNLRIFTDKKILRCDNTADSMVFKVFYLGFTHENNSKELNLNNL